MDWGWTREDCIAAIQQEGLPLPGKSSCFFCPSMKKKDPHPLSPAQGPLRTGHYHRGRRPAQPDLRQGPGPELGLAGLCGGQQESDRHVLDVPGGRPPLQLPRRGLTPQTRLPLYWFRRISAIFFVAFCDSLSPADFVLLFPNKGEPSLKTKEVRHGTHKTGYVPGGAA